MGILDNPMLNCPPGTEHPAYAHLAEGLRRRWLDDHTSRDTIYMPIYRKPLRAVLASEPPNMEPIRARTLHRRWVAAFAPYVGRPFVYLWPVAVDDLGRHISGTAQIHYMQTEMAYALGLTQWGV